jgi:hypothetical protein
MMPLLLALEYLRGPQRKEEDGRNFITTENVMVVYLDSKSAMCWRDMANSNARYAGLIFKRLTASWERDS